MSTGRRKAIILSAVFILAFAIGMMRAPEERTRAEEEGSAMNAASLPVLCASFGDMLINPLYGYAEEMDAAALAESVYPFTDAFTMNVSLLDGGALPKSVSWEVRDEADGRLIERGNTASFGGSRSDLRFAFSLQDLYEDETDYRLRFAVETEDRTAFYYTRIRKVGQETLEALTDYAVKFHDAQFDKEAAAGYAAKLEPDDKADRGTLAYVDIHCSPDQVSWGDSGAKQASKTWMTIQALHGTYGYFRFDYLAEAGFGGAKPVTFRCRETMTLQKNGKSMYLLEYERHAGQLWEANEDTVSAKGFLFGIQEDGAAEAVTGGDITAFTVNGELYAYAPKEQKLTRVFSFRRRGEHELRTLRADCGIRVMSAGEDGGLEFVVSGYMNGGTREGMSGAVCFDWDPEEGVLEEIMAVASDKSPEMVKRDTATLFTRSGHSLYFCLDRRIIAMDITSGETAVVVGSGEFGSLVQSSDRSAFAWQSGSDRAFPGAVHVLDLESGSNLTVPAGEDEFIRTLGYMREDLIIGRGKKNGKPLDDGAGGSWPMYALEILDRNLNSIMTYSYPDLYVSGIEKDSEKIIVRRYALGADGSYVAKPDDVLIRSDSESRSPGTAVSTYKHETLKRVSMLAMSKLPSYLRLTTEGNPVIREGRKPSLPEAGDGAAGYYAYAGGNFLGSFETAGAAIAAASPDYGYVTRAAGGRLVWCWSVRKDKAELSPGTIRTDLKESLDLFGVTYRNLLYFLDKGIPVRWISPDRGELWIIGHEWQRAVVYDPASRETFRMPQEEIEPAILRNDNFLRAYTD